MCQSKIMNKAAKLVNSNWSTLAPLRPVWLRLTPTDTPPSLLKPPYPKPRDCCQETRSSQKHWVEKQSESFKKKPGVCSPSLYQQCSLPLLLNEMEKRSNEPLNVRAECAGRGRQENKTHHALILASWVLFIHFLKSLLFFYHVKSLSFVSE